MDIVNIPINKKYYIEIDKDKNYLLRYKGCNRTKWFATLEGLIARQGVHCSNCEVRVPDDVINKFKFITNQ